MMARKHLPALGLALLLAVLGTAPAAAQSEGSGSGAPQGEAGVPEDPAEQLKDQETGAQSLEKAYKREFAFLEAQKRSLQQRLDEFQQQAKQEKAELQDEVAALKDRVVRLDTRIETLQEQVAEAERIAQSKKDNQEILEATIQQAKPTLSDHGFNLAKGSEFQQLDARGQVAELFDMGLKAANQAARVHREQGQFFLPDGTEVDGTLLHVGEVATYGIADEAAGALAPAGGGNLKLWKKPAADTAEALAAGEKPDPLRIFLYESADQEVTVEEEGGLLAEIQKGGTIGWIIILLGVAAGVLALLRVVILKRASASTHQIIEDVGTLVAKGKTGQAQELCDSHRGSAWRVVGAAVRNLDRDREHLEDIVSESVLNESTRLDRFGPIILVIAAVAPLLGLLGTVTGMISTFEVITEHGTGDPKLLSGGISVALVTTELGLAVAVPTLLAGNLLSGWSARIKNDMEKAALRITNLYEDRQAE
jgi:biopolymer transport protein ExbB